VDTLNGFARLYPTAAAALLLLVVVSVLFGVLMRRPMQGRVRVLHLDNDALVASLQQWAGDLKTLAISLHLGRWSDVRYALHWSTLDVPARVSAAIDAQAIGVQHAHLLGRVISQARDLSGIAVLIEQDALLPGGADVQDNTARASATEYARAVRMLCIAVERAAASLLEAPEAPSLAMPSLAIAETAREPA
jgi:hypothetical protein